MTDDEKSEPEKEAKHVDANEEKIPSSEPAPDPEVGILFTDETSGEPIGVIRFDPSGVLVFQLLIGGIHYYGFKNIEAFLKAGPMKEPMYERQAKRMDQNAKLPTDVLLAEAYACVAYLNTLDKAKVHINKYIVTADVVRR